jgi:hypothetical protein
MKNVKANLFLIISQILFGIVALISALFTLMSLLMADQFDELNALQAVSLVLLWCYPIAYVVTAVVSWLLYHKRKFKAAVWVGAIPLLWVLPLFGFFE